MIIGIEPLATHPEEVEVLVIIVQVVAVIPIYQLRRQYNHHLPGEVVGVPRPTFTQPHPCHVDRWIAVKATLL